MIGTPHYTRSLMLNKNFSGCENNKKSRIIQLFNKNNGNLQQTKIVNNLTGMSLYFRSKNSRSGKTCIQFIQQYVQKSSRTTFPFKSCSQVQI